MTPEQKQLLADKINEELAKAKTEGLLIGKTAMVGVIYTKLKNINHNSTKNDLLRVIEDIKSFCEKSLDIHVYCTDCRYFKLQTMADGKPTPYCDRPTKEYCNDWDMDDSKPYSERPFYWGRNY